LRHDLPGQTAEELDAPLEAELVQTADDLRQLDELAQRLSLDRPLGRHDQQRRTPGFLQRWEHDLAARTDGYGATDDDEGVRRAERGDVPGRRVEVLHVRHVRLGVDRGGHADDRRVHAIGWQLGAHEDTRADEPGEHLLDAWLEDVRLAKA